MPACLAEGHCRFQKNSLMWEFWRFSKPEKGLRKCRSFWPASRNSMFSLCAEQREIRLARETDIWKLFTAHQAFLLPLFRAAEPKILFSKKEFSYRKRLRGHSLLQSTPHSTQSVLRGVQVESAWILLSIFIDRKALETRSLSRKLRKAFLTSHSGKFFRVFKDTLYWVSQR